MDEKAEALEPTDSFSHTKQTIAMVLADLTKIRKLSNINMIEALAELRNSGEATSAAAATTQTAAAVVSATASNTSTAAVGDIKF